MLLETQRWIVNTHLDSKYSAGSLMILVVNTLKYFVVLLQI